MIPLFENHLNVKIGMHVPDLDMVDNMDCCNSDELRMKMQSYWVVYDPLHTERAVPL